jgi:ribokinase
MKAPDKNYDLLIVGDLNYDYLGCIPFFPAVDQEVEIDPLDGYLGGSGANAAVVAARMGCRVAFYSAIGQDANGRGLIEEIQRNGIATQFIKTVAGKASGMVFGMVTPDGERRLFCYRGANLDLLGEEIAQDALAACQRLHLNGPVYELALNLLGRARSLGIPTSMDPGSILIESHLHELPAILALTDVLFVNSVEFNLIAGGADAKEKAESLLACGVRWVVVKNGSHGCTVYPAGALAVSHPAFKIQAVDTTGSGDAFNAAFLSGLIQKLTFAETLKFANAVGALASLQMGATTGVPKSKEAVYQFMESTPLRAE